MGGQTHEQRRAVSRMGSLTRRQREVLELIALEHLTNAEIAARLIISEATVESHVHAMLKTLGLHTREQAARAFLGCA